MLLTFVENKDNIWYKKIEIEFIYDSGIEGFRFNDIIKDDKLENLQYYYNSISIFDNNKIIKTYGFNFDKYDPATKKIHLKQNPNFINKEKLLNEYDYLIMKYYKRKISEDKSVIAIDTIFNIEDLDMDKFEAIKEISKDYDSIKITEYSTDEEIKFNEYLNNNRDNKHIFDISILNEVLLIDESKNKLYVLNCPIDLEYELIGIKNFNKTILLKYDEPIDYKKDNIEFDITKIKDSKIALSNSYIFSNIFIKAKSIDEEILNKYNKQMKSLFETDIICGVYDL